MGIPGASAIRRHVSGTRYPHEPVVGSHPKLAAVVYQERGDLQVWRCARREPLAQRLSLDSIRRYIEAIESGLRAQPDISPRVLRNRQDGIAAESRRIACI